MGIGNIDFLPYPPVWLEKLDSTLEEIEEIPEKELDKYIAEYEFGEQMNELIAENTNNDKLTYQAIEERMKARRSRNIRSAKLYKQRELVNTSREEYLRRMNNLRYIR